ncbi:hypothetical protein [Mucilaginibacter gotjawali]|uniref:Uncharacterized protein n=1 Tax=Mucilaginibacter gotjawali TaxID=1550579 RepID=A0A839SE66_9SPHI|nr:hypothetical protein [Mucilaginibacter gotjawali]MBB3054939.1 hypothetical protein [Mucilaginibacter gotjawali]
MRGKLFWGALVLFIFNSSILFAQPGEPCGGTDPDATCPLDTWIIVLAVIAVISAAYHLHRKQKSPLPTANGIK